MDHNCKQQQNEERVEWFLHMQGNNIVELGKRTQMISNRKRQQILQNSDALQGCSAFFYNPVNSLSQYNQSFIQRQITLKMFGYKPSQEEVLALRERMRNGTGASRLLHADDAPTHYIDSLQRFKKDYAQYDRQQRESQKAKRQMQLEKKRLDQLERENKRWELVEKYEGKLKSREEIHAEQLRMGVKKTANSSSLAYNPINLSYDSNPQGLKLKRLDEDSQIRRYVRAKNMEDRGNSKYNPINGEYREGIQKVVPQDLNQRYSQKLSSHYDNIRLKAPSMYENSSRQNLDNQLRPRENLW